MNVTENNILISMILLEQNMAFPFTYSVVEALAIIKFSYSMELKRLHSFVVFFIFVFVSNFHPKPKYRLFQLRLEQDQISKLVAKKKTTRKKKQNEEKQRKKIIREFLVY